MVTFFVMIILLGFFAFGSMDFSNAFLFKFLLPDMYEVVCAVCIVTYTWIFDPACTKP